MAALHTIPFFRRTLLTWFSRNKRSLPWRRTADPYKILVSEVMLQQTQVDRVKGYYMRFLKAFPTPQKLAKARPVNVLKLWSGLGYNRRALLLQRTAQHVVARYGGKFPHSEEELRELPGIGPYTAGAVMAFAFNCDAVFFDTNIVRVVARFFFGVKPQREDRIEHAVRSALPHGKARTWYSALMDFGSAICTSRAPKCVACPLRRHCKAAPHFLRGGKPMAQKVSAEKFEGSNRWWRGRILKALLDGRKGESPLYHNMVVINGRRDKRKFRRALRALIREGLVRRKGNVLTL